MPGRKDMPGTLKRSPRHAQDVWVKTHDNAIREYGHGRRATQTAYAALKHEYEKKGDHWVAKGHKGPSDPGGRRRGKKTYGGVDVRGNTKEELYERAKKLDVKGRSKMTKSELARAISRKQ